MVHPLFHMLYCEWKSYFGSCGLFAWWGSPLRWQWAALLISIACVIWTIVYYRRNKGSYQIKDIATPLVLPFMAGIVFSLFQIHMLFWSIAKAGWAIFFEPIELVFNQLFASHAGFYGSVVVFFLWLYRLIRRKKTTTKQNA